ncbi:MAG: LysM peptidoglycan-binding domain-containing protein [Anaerolineae bacterium]|nr:LysM peptidoglycan-binding domain-containing protein [Anaerolineae bacterium]MDW8098102.1 LysM peptidoglycan-binding domain-containing protein [Anaerolineae bacterium]
MRRIARWLAGMTLIGAFIITPSLGTSAAPLAQGGTHVVRPGETLFSIAQRYGVTVDDLVRANGLTDADIIVVGQKLRIPGGDTDGESQSESEPGVHIVQAGETLSSIAMQYGVTVEEIAQASGISVSSILHVGQKLTIPKRASQPVAMSAPAPEPVPEPAPEVYMVQPGDTLESIAQRFGTSVASLARANQLSSPSLVFVGRRLVIPKPKVVRLYGGGKRVEVSISRQRCWVYEGDVVLYEWICSTGRPSSPTKPGSFAIQSKLTKAYGSSWNIWMPYWLGVYWAGGTENGFHGLPWNARTGRETWTGLVGTRITYGCIMLSNDNSKTLWDMAYIGMPVIIRY